MYLTSKLFEACGALHGFTTRLGGISLPPWHSLNLGFGVGDCEDAVERNFELLASRIGIGVEQIAYCKQRHTDKVLTVESVQDIAKVRNCVADALIVTTRGILVAVRTADCLPILLVDRKGSMAAAVHAGWRGTIQEILAKTVSLMLERGCQLEDLYAAIGPCIGPTNMRLAGAAKQTIEESNISKASKDYRSNDSAGVYVDLKRANFDQLVGCGVVEKNITILNSCTYSLRQQFFSFRRDGKLSGRHLNFVGWPERI